MSDLTSDRVFNSLVNALKAEGVALTGSGSNSLTAAVSRRLHAELTRPQPEYILSERLADKFWAAFHAVRTNEVEQTRAALDAVTRAAVTELAERWLGKHDARTLLNVNREELVRLLCQGLP